MSVLYSTPRLLLLLSPISLRRRRRRRRRPCRWREREREKAVSSSLPPSFSHRWVEGLRSLLLSTPISRPRLLLLLRTVFSFDRFFVRHVFSLISSRLFFSPSPEIAFCTIPRSCPYGGRPFPGTGNGREMTRWIKGSNALCPPSHSLPTTRELRGFIA